MIFMCLTSFHAGKTHACLANQPAITRSSRDEAAVSGETAGAEVSCVCVWGKIQGRRSVPWPCDTLCWPGKRNATFAKSFLGKRALRGTYDPAGPFHRSSKARTPKMKPPSINKPRRGLTHSAVWLRRNVFDGILIRPISAEW